MRPLFNRLPHQSAGWAAAADLLLLPEAEYAALLRQHGYGEHYIASELALLREARQKHNLPGPPTAKQPDDKGWVTRLAKRRQIERKD